MEWKNSGEIISLPVGNYTIEFQDISGYIKPENQNIIIIKNDLTTTTGTYQIDNRPSILTVYLNITAQWKIEGQETYYNNTDSVELSPGDYIISFTTVENHITPNNISITIPPNSIVATSGYYQKEPIIGEDYCYDGYNAIKVNTNIIDSEWQLVPSTTQYPENIYGGVVKGVICPNPIGEGWRIKKSTDTCFIKGLVSPTNIGGQWRVQGTTLWYDHDVSVQYPEGEYIVEFKPLMGYTNPKPERLILNTYETIHILGIYREDPFGGMIQYVCPQGDIGSHWRIKNITDTGTIKGLIYPSIVGQWRPQGTTTWYNHNQSVEFPEGVYIIEFKSASGFITPPNQRLILNTHDNVHIMGIYLQEG